jgi:Rod binding domain-containing protein
MNAIGAISGPRPAAAIPQPRLVQAAHEFEAQLMKELLKPLMAGAKMDGNESDAGSGGVLGDFATEALGQSLSRQGGLGIAASILRSVSQNEDSSLNSPHTGIETVRPSQKIVQVLKSC